MIAGSTLSQVKEQYEHYPYPTFSWLAGAPYSSLAHASYEAGSALVNLKIQDHAHKKILLLGCGTFEPYAMGKLHPLAQLTAVDLSRRSIRLARLRCRSRWVTNVNFVESDLVSFCDEHQGEFDYIHCYGVLHHLDDPQEGFRAVARALAPEGFARIMVYSETSRQFVETLQRGVKLLNLSAETPRDIDLARKLIECLPVEHPLRVTAMINTDTASKSGLVDSVLHVREHSFSFDELKATLANAGLSVHGWDFSQTLLRFLHDAPGRAVEDKIRWLEAFDQWPSPFVFWVSRQRPIQVESETLKLARNPSIEMKPFSNTFPSTLLRRPIHLSGLQRKIWDVLETPRSEKELSAIICGPDRQSESCQTSEGKESSPFSEALAELLSARFLLEVRT